MVRSEDFHGKIYKFVDKAFLGPQMDNADRKKTLAVYPNDGRGWRYDEIIWSLDPHQNYQLLQEWIKTKLSPANSALDKIENHRNFRINVLKWAVGIWTVAGIVSILT